MAKVIVERPRWGSSAPSRKKGYRKYLVRTGIENLPSREPMLGHWRGKGRWLNEHLAPMRRFLRSNVGRPWNKVHQELCEHVNFDNAVQSHVLTHIFQYVQQHVELHGSEVFPIRSGRRWRRPLSQGYMYICPISGLLKVVRAKSLPPLPTRVDLGKSQQIHLREGTWWKLALRPLADDGLIIRRHARRRPNAVALVQWDVWLDRWVSLDDEVELKATYGGKLTAISKRPLDPMETRDLQRRLRTKKRTQRTSQRC